MKAQLSCRLEHVSAALGYLMLGDAVAQVYRVAAITSEPRLWETYVNASSGEVLLLRDATRYHKANVFLENPFTTPELLSVELEGITEDEEHKDHTYGAYARVATCTAQGGYGCLNWKHEAVATEADGFTGFAPEMDGSVLDDGFSEVNGYFTLDRGQRWFREEMGFQGLFTDADQYEHNHTFVAQDHLWMYVNLDWDNGGFIGGSMYGMADLIILGRVDGSDFAYDSDVVLHEFTHAVSSKVFSLWDFDVDELGSDLSARGMEEGTADYFAGSINDSSAIGEFSGTARDLSNQRRCPEDIIGESHYDGWITGGTLWSIRAAIGQRKADHLHYSTMIGYPIRSFEDWGEALLDRAAVMASSSSELEEDLQLSDEDVQAIEQVIEERNLIGCRRIIELTPDGDRADLYVDTAVNNSQGTPSPLQYMVRTHDDTEVLLLDIDTFYNQDYDVLVREGMPVEYTWLEEPFLHWQAEYDMEWLAVDRVSVPVKISNTTELVLKKSTSYYFSIVSRAKNDNPHFSKISAKLLQEPEPVDLRFPVEISNGQDKPQPISMNPSPIIEPKASPETFDDHSSCRCQYIGSKRSPLGPEILLSLILMIGWGRRRRPGTTAHGNPVASGHRECRAATDAPTCRRSARHVDSLKHRLP